MFRSFLVLIMLILSFGISAAGQQISLTMNFGIADGNHSEAKISISRNGSPWKLVRPAKPSNSEVLDFANNYLITFEKVGYAIQKVAINTGGITKEQQAGGMNLTISVTLEKGVADQTPITYAYDAGVKGFKRISTVAISNSASSESEQDARKRAEATFDLITKEEEKEKQFQKHFNKEDELEGRKSEFSKKKEEPKTEEQKLAEEAKKAAIIKAAEDARQIQLTKMEEERKKAIGETAEREKAEQMKRQEEQQKQIATIKAAEVERKAQEVKTAALAREAEAARAEEERRRQEATAKADLEKRKREAQQKFKQEQQNVVAAPKVEAEQKPMTIEEAGNIVSRTEEIIQEEKRIIKQITIKRERHTFVYRMVKYDWGGVFYFKNEMDMTKLDFDSETSLKQ